MSGAMLPLSNTPSRRGTKLKSTGTSLPLPFTCLQGSSPSSAEVKNAWSYNCTPQYAFMVWCSIKKSTGTTLPLPVTRQYHTA